jgi:hypothetical protein
MRLNCGDTCPKSGHYKVVDSKGNVVNTVDVAEGETMPPTQYSDCHYESENQVGIVGRRDTKLTQY